MRKTILLFAVIFACIKLSAQSYDLKFTQVIDIPNGQSYTVPTGRVFKLESFTTFSPSLTYNFVNCTESEGFATCNYAVNLFTIGNLTDPLTYSLDGGSQCTGSNCSSTVTLAYSIPALTFPIWLKAGETVSLANGTGMLMTGLEFAYQ